MILDQRSDIEQFFLEALEQVKEEKRRKLEAERNAQLQQQQNMSGGQGLHKYMAQDQLAQAKQSRITVELGDLDWEDRERILRLLFSKMNTGQSAADWRDVNDGQGDGNSQAGTNNLDQSFKEQDEEDEYGEQDADANIFDATKIPDNGYGN